MNLSDAEIPRATYRVQLHRGFGFADAQRLVPYLARLGISHLYTSPVLTARPGSTHGYDMIDPTRVNPELGGDEGFDALCRTLAEHGMKLLLDLVPNHMGVFEADNIWWLDVLEHGRASRFADWFDIDWRPPGGAVHDQVLMPVLGAPYGEVLESGDLRLVHDTQAQRLELRYHAHRLPLDPQTCGDVLRIAAPQLQALSDAFDTLPPRTAFSDDARQIRFDAAQVLKGELARQLPAGEVTLPLDALDGVISRQAWRVAHWRLADSEINYRRFFDIDGLAALRMERDDVFEAVHHCVFEWLRDGRVAGLRIDHPDGLADPGAYFERLQQRHVELTGRPLYLVIEKILADDEMCPAAWPVHGDTGYRWASDACALFVDPRHEADFGRIQAQFTGESDGFDTIAHDAKRQIIETALATDLEWLVDRAWQLSRNDLRARDFGRAMLREAITELAAGMRVYRTYLDGEEPSREDRTRLQVAAQAAQQRLVPSMAPALQWVIERLLDARHGMALAFVRRFQQFTAPVMAKAVEDTALYRYHRLLCLNDVGSDPRRFGIDAATFHTRNAHRAKCQPHAMLASSTHDSKRSEDVRLRLAVLSEMPQDWHATVLRWRTWIGDTSVSASDVYLLMQTLVGVWPSHGEVPDDALWQRVCDYMAKAVREGKRRTSWTDPDASYEEAMATLVQLLSGTPGFVNDVARFVEPLAVVGALNSLAMLACKLTAPGVPDVYQGCEAPCFSLVDPDNRRLPPFERLASALSSRPASPADMLRDGRAKQWVTQRLLQWRAREPALWRRGHYDALPAHGANAGHVVAFARGGRCVTVVGRLLWQLCAGAPSVLLDGACWSDTAIDMPPGKQWQDVITSRLLTTDASGRLSLRQALQAWPVAVLSPAA